MNFSELLLTVFPCCVLIVACTVASITDLRQRIIPNGVCYATLIAGLGMHVWIACATIFSAGAMQGGTGLVAGLPHGLLGTLSCGAALFPFWIAGGIGGGDLKFMAAIGMIVGPVLGLKILVIGCLLAILFVIASRLFGAVRRRIRSDERTPEMVREDVAPVDLPMAGFLSLATLVVVFHAILLSAAE